MTSTPQRRWRIHNSIDSSTASATFKISFVFILWLWVDYWRIPVQMLLPIHAMKSFSAIQIKLIMVFTTAFWSLDIDQAQGITTLSTRYYLLSSAITSSAKPVLAGWTESPSPFFSPRSNNKASLRPSSHPIQSSPPSSAPTAAILIEGGGSYFGTEKNQKTSSWSQKKKKMSRSILVIALLCLLRGTWRSQWWGSLSIQMSSTWSDSSTLPEH